MNNFAQKLKVKVSTLSITNKEDNKTTVILLDTKNMKEVFRTETTVDENRTTILKRKTNGNIIYAEHTIVEGNNTSKTLTKEKNGIIVKKYKQYIKTLSNGKIVYSKTITYECNGKSSDKISCIEYKSTEDRYTRMDWVDIIKCPYNDSSIVIAYSPYRIRAEKPLIAGVVKLDYNNIDNNSIVLPDYTTLPLYKANSDEYKWAQNVLKQKKGEYKSIVNKGR